MDGQFVEWSPEGKPTMNQTYQAGRKLARKTSHHTGGAKKSEGMYLFAKEIEQTPDDWWNLKAMTLTKTGKDEKHGPWQSFHANGQKQIEGTYEHDLQVGKFNWWHANGLKQTQGEFAAGNRTGKWMSWTQDGKLADSNDASDKVETVADVPRLEPVSSPPGLQAIEPAAASGTPRRAVRLTQPRRL